MSHYIALDSSDLRALKGAVERAVEKEAAIKESLKMWPLVEIQGQEYPDYNEE
jgi:hypothetical protein